MAEGDQDAITVAASWEGGSFHQEEEEGQPSPVFPDLLEEVRSERAKTSNPSGSLQGMEELGLAEFPPVDSTIAALVQALPVGGLPKDPTCPNCQCRVTEMHLKKAYTAEAQVMRLANTPGLLMAYLDGILQLASLPERMASELHLVLNTLLQIRMA
ncbi:UNVERIFIED_CONTAM: hypothetical protein FKN15_024499 [Acipenser sinensis]